VGVGRADFSSMDELDSDKGLLRGGGKVAARDIVQFVEMARFSPQDKAGLAKHVLAEIPQQVVAWMTMKGYKPEAVGQ